ncbi:Protein kinase-like domain containing protein [Naviculisporaceae sp. PSN 640]
MRGYSAASSVRFGQEPFPYFEKKIMTLLTQELFPDEDPSTIVLERMRGGTYNRVVGVTIGTGDKQQRLILRVPRTKDFCPPTQLALIDITEDIAPLLFVQKAGIPCPEISSFDHGLSNPLGLPFMLQKRVKGTCLLDCLHTLTHPQRRRLAQELGVAYRKMLATTSSVPGRIIIDKSPIQSGPPADDWKIVPFLNGIFKKRQEVTKPTVEGNKYIALYAKHRKYIDNLRRKGLLDSSRISYCLTHGDLWPRNVMVNPDAAEDEPFLTILDWDSAMFLPSFTMAVPPVWVWDPEYYTEPEHDHFDRDPSDPWKCELKQIFERAAGREYLRYSSMHDYKYMRRVIMEHAVRGVKIR